MMLGSTISFDSLILKRSLFFCKKMDYDLQPINRKRIPCEYFLPNFHNWIGVKISMKAHLHFIVELHPTRMWPFAHSTWIAKMHSSLLIIYNNCQHQNTRIWNWQEKLCSPCQSMNHDFHLPLPPEWWSSNLLLTLRKILLLSRHLWANYIQCLNCTTI